MRTILPAYSCVFISRFRLNSIKCLRHSRRLPILYHCCSQLRVATCFDPISSLFLFYTPTALVLHRPFFWFYITPLLFLWYRLTVSHLVSFPSPPPPILLSVFECANFSRWKVQKLKWQDTKEDPLILSLKKGYSLHVTRRHRVCMECWK